MCECIEKLDQQIAGKNIRIARGLQLVNGSFELTPPYIETEKLNKALRTKTLLVIASFCPFCGEAYRKD